MVPRVRRAEPALPFQIGCYQIATHAHLTDPVAIRQSIGAGRACDW